MSISRSATLMAFGAAAVAAWASRPPPLKERAEAVIAASTEHSPEAVVQRVYARLPLAELTPQRLKAIDLRTLELLFEAIFCATQYSIDDASTEVLSAIQVEARSRGYAGFNGVIPEALFQRALERRDFSLARRLAANSDALAFRLPRVVTPPVYRSIPAVLLVSGDGRTLTWAAADLGPGPKLVAIVAPGCHFSKQAMTALAGDAALRRAAARGLYVDNDLADAAAIASANRGNWFRYDLLYKREDWPKLDFNRTPVFYFFRHNAVVAKIEGYRPNEFLDDFHRGLSAAGM